VAITSVTLERSLIGAPGRPGLRIAPSIIQLLDS
jgi:hypothetical protein